METRLHSEQPVSCVPWAHAGGGAGIAVLTRRPQAQVKLHLLSAEGGRSDRAVSSLTRQTVGSFPRAARCRAENGTGSARGETEASRTPEKKRMG